MDKIPYPNNVDMESMSLRDYFAAKALQALLTRENTMHPNPLMYAGAAYDLADAMLEQRLK
jgi:hypothetical protein